MKSLLDSRLTRLVFTLPFDSLATPQKFMLASTFTPTGAIAITLLAVAVCGVVAVLGYAMLAIIRGFEELHRRDRDPGCWHCRDVSYRLIGHSAGRAELSGSAESRCDHP